MINVVLTDLNKLSLSKWLIILGFICIVFADSLIVGTVMVVIGFFLLFKKYIF